MYIYRYIYISIYIIYGKRMWCTKKQCSRANRICTWTRKHMDSLARCTQLDRIRLSKSTPFYRHFDSLSASVLTLFSVLLTKDSTRNMLSFFLHIPLPSRYVLLFPVLQSPLLSVLTGSCFLTEHTSNSWTSSYRSVWMTACGQYARAPVEN